MTESGVSGKIGYRAQDLAVLESPFKTGLVCELKITLTRPALHTNDIYYYLSFLQISPRRGNCVGASAQYMSCCLQVRIPINILLLFRNVRGV